MALLTTIEIPMYIGLSKRVIDIIEKEARTQLNVIGVSVRYSGVGYTNRIPVLIVNTVQVGHENHVKLAIRMASWVKEREIQLTLNHE